MAGSDDELMTICRRLSTRNRPASDASDGESRGPALGSAPATREERMDLGPSERVRPIREAVRAMVADEIAPLRMAIARNANRHAEDLRAVVADIRTGGATSLRTIAAELNARGILTRRGGRWHVSTVLNLFDRLDGGPSSMAAGPARR
jgi:hypothetical protein